MAHRLACARSCRLTLMPSTTQKLTRQDAAEASLSPTRIQLESCSTPGQRWVAENSQLLTTIQTAAELNISKRSLQELVADRKIGFIKFGRNIRFDREDIDRFIESHRQRPVGWKMNSAGGARA